MLIAVMLHPSFSFKILKKYFFWDDDFRKLLEIFQRFHYSIKVKWHQVTHQSQLFYISLLQCYKNIKESTPHTELPLNLCNVIYVPKEGRKKRHELRFSLPGGEALVLAVQSKEQAQRWLKVPFFSFSDSCC